MHKNISAINAGLRELYPLFCGFQICQKGHFYGPAVRDHFIVHCVRSGKGIFTRGENEYHLSERDCFLIRPNEITFYKADESEPWEYTWIAFSGENARFYLETAGVYERPVFGSDKISSVFEELHRQIQSGELSQGRNEFGMLSILYAFFAALPVIKSTESLCDQYVHNVYNYVGNMISNTVTVKQLAAFCGLERHYLCRIFKKETGQTPQEYIIGCKMKKARELLVYTSLSIGNVAHSVGYTDVYNFSKIFKKYSGVSPLNFRKAQPLCKKAEAAD